jgi:hypothetical protein
MTYGPLVAADLILASGISEPGYYVTRRGVVLVAAYRGGFAKIPLDGDKPCVDDQALPDGPSIKLPQAEIEASFDSPVRYDDSSLWGIGHLVVASKESGQVCLAVVAREEAHGEFQRVLIDLGTCRAVAPEGNPREWVWLPTWQLSMDRNGRGPWKLANSPPPPPPELNIRFI